MSSLARPRSDRIIVLVKRDAGPGWVTSSQFTKVAGSIPGQATQKKQPVNVSVSGTTDRCFSLSLSPLSSLSLKSINYKKREQERPESFLRLLHTPRKDP